MVLRLADGVRVRKESWGLLFYSPPRHKVCFVRSGDWLSPDSLVGEWTVAGLAEDIAARTGAPAEAVERSLEKMTGQLINSRMVVDELR
jgi:putative mycofactocin binding protein MftB